MSCEPSSTLVMMAMILSEDDRFDGVLTHGHAVVSILNYTYVDRKELGSSLQIGEAIYQGPFSNLVTPEIQMVKTSRLMLVTGTLEWNPYHYVTGDN